ncbi:uncharacterized protein V2V93DRAFT_375950 [Kockiozyma suomiensis]|uniref:uncharacterized protein n=1 Tax=Kockiozyma suomiensis TaxID=1337062 RepID=UPI0033436E67
MKMPNNEEISPLSIHSRTVEVAPYTLFLHLTVFPSTAATTATPTSTTKTAAPLILNITTSSPPMPLTSLSYSLPASSSSSSSSSSQSKSLSTTLLGGQNGASEESVEFASRLGAACARRFKRPVYVGASVGQFLGQVEAMSKIIEFVNEFV